MNVRDRIERGFEAWGHFAFRRAPLVILLVVAGVAGLASQIPKIRFETAPETFLHPGAPLRVDYEAFRRQFGRDDVIVLAVETPDVFAPEALESLRSIHEAVEARVPYLEDVTSLVNARETRGEADELVVGELIEDWPDSPEAFADVGARAHANRLLPNLLFAPDDGVSLIVVETTAFTSTGTEEALEGFDDFEAAEGGDGAAEEPEVPAFITSAENREVVKVIESIAAEYETADLRIHVTGMGALVVFLEDTMQRDMARFTGLGILTIALFLGALFRRLSGVLLPLVVVIASVLSTVASMAILGYPISLPTQILPSLLLAVGVGASVHVMAIFFQRLHAGASKQDAIAGALGHSGLAISMTSLTTMGALMSFATAEMKPVADFGVVGPLGVAVAFVMTVVLLPALIAVARIRPSRSGEAERSGVSQRWLERCGDFALDHRRAVLAVAAALVAVGLVGASKIQLSHHPLEWFALDNPFRVASELMNEELGGMVNLEAVIDSGRENGLQDPALLARLDVLQEHLLAEPRMDMPVAKATSLADVVQEIHQALNENRPEFYRVPEEPALVAQELLLFENSGSDDLEDVTDARFQLGRLSLKVPFVDAVRYEPWIEAVEQDFREILGEDVDVTYTGLMPILSGTIRAMLYSLITSYSLAFVVITPLMVLLIGRLKLGLASMIPNLTPIVLVLGVMGWAEMPMSGLTLLTGSIAIGLAVDDTIHFMHNFRRYFDAERDVRLAVRKTLATTGQAMLFTSLVLATGFALFTFSSMEILLQFGGLTALAIVLAFASDIFLAPALVATLEKNP